MINSIGKSISSVIDERLSSPMVSSFVIAWSLINYKFFVLLLSNTPATQTFDLIDKICFPDWQAWLLQGFFYPLVASAFYIFMLPYPSRYVYEAWRRHQKQTDDIREKYESEKRLTVLESREYRQKAHELEASLDKANDTIRTMRADLQAANQRADEFESLANSTEEIRAESKGLRDKLVATHEELDRAREQFKRAAGWVKELIGVAELGDKPIEEELSALEHAFSAQLIQNGVRDQVQLDSARKTIKPFIDYRKALVITASRIERDFAMLSMDHGSTPTSFFDQPTASIVWRDREYGATSRVTEPLSNDQYQLLLRMENGTSLPSDRNASDALQGLADGFYIYPVDHKDSEIGFKVSEKGKDFLQSVGFDPSRR